MQSPQINAATGYLIALDSRDLLVGMYVCELDCPWSDTPFPLGGFHVKRAEDIQTLQKFCRHVTIDTNKGAEPARRKRTDLTILSSARRAAPVGATLKVNRDTYPVTHSIKQLLDKGSAAYDGLQTQFQAICVAVREGRTMNLQPLEPLIKSLVDSLLANPQALIWLLFTDTSARFPISYCVRAAIWAAMLGRQVGLKRNDIEILFLGTLLCDIGMNLLPERLVNKRGHFRKKEFLAYRKHIEFGLELLSQHSQADERILRIVRCHHERHDGRGFPRKIKGDQIPSLARYANLAYCFEQLVGTNSDKRKISPAQATARLYKQRVIKFPEQLVVELIHVLGMYPIGTLVAINSGEYALVLNQNETQRLSPRVALLTDAARQPLKTPRVVDLASDNDSSSRCIEHAVSLEQFPIDLSAYRFEFFGKKIGLGPLAIRL